VAFRFSNKGWAEWPLSAEKFAKWANDVNGDGYLVNLFMDYETFGEHQGAHTGILEFMRHLPRFVLADERFSFRTPSEVAAAHEAVAELDVPEPLSWADAERDLTAWLGNDMQKDAHARLYELLPAVRDAAAAGHPEFLAEWRKLSTSDHVYYMSTKWQSDGDVHEYFSPYDSPHDAYVNFMNALEDLSIRVANALPHSTKKRRTPKRRP
jgi:alpha-amylase